MIRKLPSNLYSWRLFPVIPCLILLAACTTTPPESRFTSTQPLPPTGTPAPAQNQPTPPKATQLGKGKPESIAWSPDGHLFAVSGTKGIDLYNTTTWQVKQHIDVSMYDSKSYHRGEVGQVVFHPDGQSLFFVLIPRVSIYRYDLASEQAALVYQNMAYAVKAVPVIAPDVASFAYWKANCSELGTISCWYGLEIYDMATGDLVHSLLSNLSEEYEAIHSVCFSPDGRHLAAGSADGLVRLWDAASGELRYTLRHDSDVYSVTFSPDGKVLASASEDATVRFWDSRTGQLLYTLRGFARGALFVSYVAKANQLLVGLTDGTFDQWSLDAQGLPLKRQGLDLKSDLRLPSYSQSRGGLKNQIVTNDDGNRLAVLSDRYVKVWDLSTGSLVTSLPEFNTAISALVFSADGKTLAVSDHAIHLWQVASKQFIATLPENPARVISLAFRPDGRQIAATTMGRAQVWDLTTQQMSFEIDDDRPTHLAYAPNGKRLATLSHGYIKLWDAVTGQLTQNVALDAGEPLDLTFSLDGSQVICAGENGVFAWDLASGKLREVISPANRNRLSEAALNPQTNLAALEMQDGHQPVSFFDLLSGKHRYDFYFSGAGRGDLKLSANGQLLAHTDSDHIVLSDSSSGQNLLTLPGTTLNPFAFSPDGHTLAVADEYQGIFQLLDISSAAQRSAEVPLATATPAPSSTPSPSPEPWPSRTQPPPPVVTIQPVLPPTPQPGAITAENAGQLQEQEQYGLGHAETAAWSADGKTLAVGGTRGVYLFTGASRPAAFFDTDEFVLRIAFSPDGRLLAGYTAGKENTLRVWDIRGGTSLYQLDEEGICYPTRYRLYFSPDSQVLVSHCKGDMLHQWDMQSGKLLNREADSEKTALDFTPDHSLALVKEGENTRLISTASGEILKTFKTTWSATDNVAFSPDGKTLLVDLYHEKKERWANLTRIESIADETQLWQVLPGGQPPVLRATLASNEELAAFAFAPDSRRVATVNSGGLIRIWDTALGKRLSTTESAGGRLFFSPDSSRLLALNPAGKIQVWDVTPGINPRLQQTLDGFGSRVDALAFTPDGKSLLVGSTQSFQRWSRSDGSEWRIPTLSLVFKRSSSAVNVSADGRYLAMGAERGSIQVWDAQNGTLLQTLSGHPTAGLDGTTDGYVAVFTFHPNSKQFASGGADGKIRLWDAATGQQLSELKTEGSILTSYLSFSPNGHYLATSNRDSPIELWDLDTGQRLRQMNFFARSFAFGPDGVTLAISAQGLPLLLVDIRTGKIIQTLPTQTVAEKHIFSPDGGLLATINVDDVVLWDVSKGRVVLRISQRDIASLAFSPDGKTLAIGYGDGVVKVWKTH